MADQWGMRIRDDAGQVIFNSVDSDPLFHYEVLTIPPSTADYYKSYPELSGKRVVLSIQPSVTAESISPTPSQVQLTYPGGVPTIRVAAYSSILGRGPMVLVVLRPGDDGGGGTWGARYLNQYGRVAIHQNLDAYVYLGKYVVVPTGIAAKPGSVEVVSEGRPVVYLQMGSVPALIHSIVQGSAPNRWIVRAYGAGRGRDLYVRVFGRISLNYPNGSGAQWGYRQRSEDGSRIVFDSGLRFLQMKQYTASSVYTIEPKNQSFDMGFPLSSTSVDCTALMNFGSAQYTNTGSSGGGGGCRYSWFSNSYIITLSVSGNTLVANNELIATDNGSFIDTCGPTYVENFGFDTRVDVTINFIDNALYP